MKSSLKGKDYAKLASAAEKENEDYNSEDYGNEEPKAEESDLERD
jgi:hypothetical protein